MNEPDPRQDDAVLRLLERVPEGWSEASYDGRRWGVTRTTRTGGRSTSVYAEALDGDGVVSTNAYALGEGWVLKPCEMPLDVVTGFLEGVEVVAISPAGRGNGAQDRDEPGNGAPLRPPSAR